MKPRTRRRPRQPEHVYPGGFEQPVALDVDTLLMRMLGAVHLNHERRPARGGEQEVAATAGQLLVGGPPLAGCCCEHIQRWLRHQPAAGVAMAVVRPAQQRLLCW